MSNNHKRNLKPSRPLPESRHRQHRASETPFMHAIEKHVARHLGPAQMVFHELVSDLVHIDIHVVPPNTRAPFWFLFTTGMSALPMTMPACAPGSHYAELSILLPPTWRLDRRHESCWGWPIRELNGLARLPHTQHSWLGPGHTIASRNRPFDASTELAGMLVLPSGVSVPEELQTIQAGDSSIDLFTLWPIHADEMQYKLTHGVEALIDAFEAAGVSDIVDPQRASAIGPPLGAT